MSASKNRYNAMIFIRKRSDSYAMFSSIALFSLLVKVSRLRFNQSNGICSLIHLAQLGKLFLPALHLLALKNISLSGKQTEKDVRDISLVVRQKFDGFVISLKSILQSLINVRLTNKKKGWSHLDLFTVLETSPSLIVERQKLNLGWSFSSLKLYRILDF